MISKKMYKTNQFLQLFMLFAIAPVSLQANPFSSCFTIKKNDVYEPTGEMTRRPVKQIPALKSLNPSAATSKETLAENSPEEIFSPRSKPTGKNKTTSRTHSPITIVPTTSFNGSYCYGNHYYNCSNEDLKNLGMHQPLESSLEIDQIVIFSLRSKPTPQKIADPRLVALGVQRYKNENYKYIN
jgi:hypothetical protein